MIRWLQPAAILLLASAALAGEEPAKSGLPTEGLPTEGLPTEKERWIRVETDHFTVLGNAPRPRVVRIGENLERLRSVLAHTSVGMKLQSSNPTHLFVFKDRESFRPYSLDDDGIERSWAGYFVGAPDGNYVAVDASAGAAPFEVVYHEYLHYVLRNTLPGLPLWLNEGLAEYYSNFEVVGGRARIGMPIDAHLAWLSSHPLIPIEDLFSLHHESAAYHHGPLQGTIYAQSWALTHYLLADEDRRGKMPRLFELVREGRPAREAFEVAYDTDLGTVERELRDYIRSGSYAYYQFTPGNGFEAAQARIHPVGHAEALGRLGDLLVHVSPNQFQAAERHLRRALELDDERPETYRSLALLKLLDRQPGVAALFCEMALRHGLRDDRTYVLYGRALMHQYLEDDWRELLEHSETHPYVRKAREQYRRALELAPSNVEALIELGRTFLYGDEAEDVEEGAAAFARALLVAPTRAEAGFDLITLRARRGEKAEAKRVLDRILRPIGDAERTRSAEAMVAEIDLVEARRLLNAGKRQEAENLIRTVAHEVEDTELKLTLLTQLIKLSEEGPSRSAVATFNRALALSTRGDMETATILLEELLETAEQPDLLAAARTHLVEMRRTLAHNRLVDRYNRAVRLANGGRWEEAAGLLEELLNAQPADELRSATEQLLREIQRAPRR